MFCQHQKCRQGSREIATVAALVTMGNALSRLKVHVNGALNVGCSQTEVIKVINRWPSMLDSLQLLMAYQQQRKFLMKEENNERWKTLFTPNCRN